VPTRRSDALHPPHRKHRTRTAAPPQLAAATPSPTATATPETRLTVRGGIYHAVAEAYNNARLGEETPIEITISNTSEVTETSFHFFTVAFSITPRR